MNFSRTTSDIHNNNTTNFFNEETKHDLIKSFEIFVETKLEQHINTRLNHHVTKYESFIHTVMSHPLVSQRLHSYTSRIAELEAELASLKTRPNITLEIVETECPGCVAEPTTHTDLVGCQYNSDDETNLHTEDAVGESESESESDEDDAIAATPLVTDAVLETKPEEKAEEEEEEEDEGDGARFGDIINNEKETEEAEEEEAEEEEAEEEEAEEEAEEEETQEKEEVLEEEDEEAEEEEAEEEEEEVLEKAGEEEEEEEVFEVIIKSKTFYTNDIISGSIYSKNLDGSVGDEIGKFINKAANFFPR